MIVVATPLYTETDAPAVPRIRNATGSSFEIKLQNPGDSLAVTPSSVHYLVVEEGVYNVAEHGIKMEAVKYTSTVTDNKSLYVGETRTYANSYTSPVVFGQVMSLNDVNWSVFYSMGSNRQDSPTSSLLKTGKTVCEDTNKVRADETIGYIVVEAGTSTVGGKRVTVAIGSDSVMGMDDVPSYNYTFSAQTSVETVVMSMPGLDGGDGCWAVLYEAPTQTSIKLAVDEDQIGDTERNHTAEQVFYLIIETP